MPGEIDRILLTLLSGFGWNANLVGLASRAGDNIRVTTVRRGVTGAKLGVEDCDSCFDEGKVVEPQQTLPSGEAGRGRGAEEGRATERETSLGEGASAPRSEAAPAAEVVVLLACSLVRLTGRVVLNVVRRPGLIVRVT